MGLLPNLHQSSKRGVLFCQQFFFFFSWNAHKPYIMKLLSNIATYSVNVHSYLVKLDYLSCEKRNLLEFYFFDQLIRFFDLCCYVNLLWYTGMISRKNQQKRVIEVTADGLSSDPWAWRKYGQKPIKGSIYPRYIYTSWSFKKVNKSISIVTVISFKVWSPKQ